MLRRCGVVGHPVAHSLSPAMHRAAYASLGLDWTYDAIDVAPGDLATHVAGLGGAWRGLSVTAPHKRDALRLADVVEDVARVVGGANTLVLEDGIRAYNSDVAGLVAALRERGVSSVHTVGVLGAGATASSAVAAAARMGARSVQLLVRDPARASETVAVAVALDLDVDVAVLGAEAPTREVDLLVSTVPAAAAAKHAAGLVGTAGAVFDVVYDPWPTPLAKAAEDEGLTVVTGLDLLVHQAVVQVELMTGSSVPVALLRDAAERELWTRVHQEPASH